MTGTGKRQRGAMVLGAAFIAGVASVLALPSGGIASAAAHADVGAPSSARSLLVSGRLVPTPGMISRLSGVYCTLASNCWAVGQYDTSSGGTDRGHNQALHWNGRTWSRVRLPDPASGYLDGVYCTSPGNCWAVGGAGLLNEALHWNGRRWSQARVPSPGGTTGGFSSLGDVRCTAARDCWAVGEYQPGTSGAPTLNQVLHWNGRKWSKVSVPNPGGTASRHRSEVFSVRCPSLRDCWAVGDYSTGPGSAASLNQVLHWNGRRWLQARVLSPGGAGTTDGSGLDGLSCTSPGNCWAVGAYGILGSTGTILDQTLHWNGRKWRLIPAPQPGGQGSGASSQLSNVSCASARDCWAVGSYLSPGPTVATVLNQTQHWNGTGWSQIPAPSPGGTASNDLNMLEGIRCTSVAYCWAVGWVEPIGGSGANQALRWNKGTWSVG